MLLSNLRSPDKRGLFDIRLKDDRIVDIRPSEPSTQRRAPTAGTLTKPYNAPTPGTTLDFNGALVFPGLINSHDHLDFNLFPRLGNRTYHNYTEWGPDIHSNNRTSIDPILAIPQHLRTQWGIYKNLLNGFTTVVNHGEYLDTANSPITVFQECYCLHSVGFEPHWKWEAQPPRKNRSSICPSRRGRHRQCRHSGD